MATEKEMTAGVLRSLGSIIEQLPDSLTRAGQYRVELAADQFFDELPSPIAHRGLDRIKPIVEKLGSRLGFTLRGIGLRDNAGHGVVLRSGASTPDDSRFDHLGDYATFNSNQLRDGTRPAGVLSLRRVYRARLICLLRLLFLFAFGRSLCHRSPWACDGHRRSC